MALPPIDPEAAYDMRGAADYLGFHPATVRLLITSGRLGGFRAGHALRTTGADIIAFRASGGDAAGVHHQTTPPPVGAGPGAGAAAEVTRRPRRPAPAQRVAAARS